MSIRMLLVDDQEMIRMDFRMVLDTTESIEAVDEAPGGDEVLDVLAERPANVVLMDVRMPRVDGIKTTRYVMALEDPPHVLVLTTFDLDEYAYEALRAGALGFLLKGAPPEEMATAIRCVHDGDAMVASSTMRRLLGHLVAPEASPLAASTNTAPLGLLASCEREVLSLVMRGLSNHEIADELVLSEGTVKIRVGHVLTKLDSCDRVQAVVPAYEAGLIAPRSA